MRRRQFLTGKPYRIIEMRQPISRLTEKLLDTKIQFLFECHAKQDLEGFIKWDRHYTPHVLQLSGPSKGRTLIGLPSCRILAIKQRITCNCLAYPYPHRLGSGDCPHAAL